MMHRAQTAKQFQSNDQRYHDDMQGNPESGIKRKTQISVMFQRCRRAQLPRGPTEEELLKHTSILHIERSQ
jgi:hypothetical protein